MKTIKFMKMYKKPIIEVEDLKTVSLMNGLVVSNGTPMMSQITGTGCMLGAICACFLAKEKSLSSVIRATSFFGIAGEEASDRLQNRPVEYRFKNLSEDYNKMGNGSFLISLLDAISLTDATAIDKKMKVEYKNKKTKRNLYAKR